MTLVERAKALGWDGARVARELDFRVCDLSIQCVLLRADRDLHDLAWALGDEGAATEVGHWIARSDAALRRLRADDGSFRSLDLRTGKLVSRDHLGNLPAALCPRSTATAQAHWRNCSSA